MSDPSSDNLAKLARKPGLLTQTLGEPFQSSRLLLTPVTIPITYYAAKALQRQVTFGPSSDQLHPPVASIGILRRHGIMAHRPSEELHSQHDN